jgi:HAMP domain-containing protein
MADSGGEHRHDSRNTAAGGAIVASALAGAMVGAAGLAWWLLSEADRRRQARRQLRRLVQLGDPQSRPIAEQPSRLDPQLHDRVQQLNQAIDEVRRQPEQLQPSP